MKHVFVTQDFPPDLGGMARRHVELCRRAPEPLVVSTVAAADGGVFDRGEGYPVRRQPFVFSRAKRFANQLRWAGALTAEGRGADTILHCGNVRPCGYAVRLAAARTRAPYLVYVYGGDVLREQRKAEHSALKRFTGRHIFARAAGIVAISAWTAARTRELLAALGSPPPPIAEIPLGTDPRQFHPGRDRGALRRRMGVGDAPLLLTVARLVPHKGQDMVIRALAALSGEFPHLHYVAVGEGADRARLIALARACGVAERVHLTGALADDEVAESYATATLYVGLSRVDDVVNAEGFGLAFVEAGASGVPSVAGDAGGVRSAVRDGETGLLVDPTDVSAAASAIARLLRNAEQRRGLGAAARQAVETYFNWDRVARETFGFAREVAASWH